MRKIKSKKSFKAFSLIELILALTLGSIIMLSMTRWVTGVGQVVTSSITSNGKFDQEVALAHMESELISVRPCDILGYRSPINSYDPINKSITFTTSSTINSAIIQVTYKINNGSLLRGESEATSECEFSNPTSWSTVISNIDDNGSSLGYLVRGNQEPFYIFTNCTYIGDANCNISSIYLLQQ